MSWSLPYILLAVNVLLPVFGIACGWHFASRLRRLDWGETSRAAALTGFGTGAACWLVFWLAFALMANNGPLRWSMLAAVVAIYAPPMAVIATRPTSPKPADREV